MYPAWMVLFLPAFIYFLRRPVVRVLGGRLAELANDCYDNLVLLVFFAASTTVLWNGAAR